jgi:hypothetical protein
VREPTEESDVKAFQKYPTQPGASGSHL